MLKYGKEFKELFGMELEDFELYQENSGNFLFDILSFEEVFGDIDILTEEQQKLMYLIGELY